MCASALKGGADIEASIGGYTVLIQATRGGHAECVRILLASGANTNVKSDRGQGLTALDYARTRGYQDIVALLTADAGGNEASKYCEYASDCFGSCRCS